MTVIDAILPIRSTARSVSLWITQESHVLMCGITGVIDLCGGSDISQDVLQRMSLAIVHRGPDEHGYFRGGGVGLASRRLSIVDLADGQQPLSNEDGSVIVVYNGELFDHAEQRRRLEAKGHVFRTRCDTEIIVHLWEEYGERFFDHLHGQFAFVLYDHRRREVILARDRVGICPLYWARRGDRLFFGSEIKSLLASGCVEPRVDVRGIDHIFCFFGMPVRRTPFEGVSAILPGHYLKIALRSDRSPADIHERTYWDLDFPDAGDEHNPRTAQQAADEFQSIFFDAVDRRLHADVPVVSYLSGGVDSAAVLATATQLRGTSIPSFTIQIDSPFYDESGPARVIAQHTGSPQTIVRCDTTRLLDGYHWLVTATESPVTDTSCAGLYALAEEVRHQGYKVALTGEGSDEAMGGYPWFKINRLLNLFDCGRVRPSALVRWLCRPVIARQVPWSEWAGIQNVFGGPLAQVDLYRVASSTRRLFYRDEVLDDFDGWIAFQDLELDLDRMRRWHPLNRSLYAGYKTILPGLLLSQKSDRVAMANSVETRYPFLDDGLISYLAGLHPRWKLRGIRGDKRVLRLMAERLLPRHVARQPKKMFRAPFGDTLFQPDSPIVQQLLSRESLEKTGIFDPARVHRAWKVCRQRARLSPLRFFEEMGLVSVFATQMWHHIFISGDLCEAPIWSARLTNPLSTQQPSASAVDTELRR
ncbi:asparagine synthase (glutamine-hydrolyzing) [bacterium]|nr:asparagine synthase (glutamine-hydrolyzing) [bacterium]